MFVPDAKAPGEEDHLEVSMLHRGDEELERQELREVSRKRGRRDGVEGWWVEKEFRVLAIPECKTLFTFGGEGKKGR